MCSNYEFGKRRPRKARDEEDEYEFGKRRPRKARDEEDEYEFGKRRPRKARDEEEYDEYEFGKRRVGRPRKRQGRGRKVASGRRSIMIRGRKRKLYRGKNGGYYYRTRSGKSYIKGRRSSRFGEEYTDMNMGEEYTDMNMGEEYTDVEFGKRRPRKARDEEDEYEFGIDLRHVRKQGPREIGPDEMEFGATSKELQMLQLIADDLTPNFKYSSQVGRNGNPKLLTAAALKKKLTKSNIDWKRSVMIFMRDDPRFMPRGGVKFKGGFKYLRMVANRYFGPEFKYSGKVGRNGRPKLLSEAALKRKLSAVFKGTGYDWKQIANETRMDVLEIYKQIKISLQNSGMNKTKATKVANKIMKDNEEGIGMGPRTWYYGFRQGVERGEDFEGAAWRSTDESLRQPPLNPELAAAASRPAAAGRARPGSMMERWQMDADSGYLGQSGPFEDGYRPASMAWRAEQDNIPPPGMFGGGGEWADPGPRVAWEGRRNGAAIDDPDSLIFDNDLSERLLGFGMNCNQRKTR
jgi:hypothetical protein